MKHTHYPHLILLAVLFLFASCQSDPPSDPVDNQPAAPLSIPTPETKPPTASSSNWSYYHLDGVVADLPVTMELTREDSPYYSDGGYFKGYYRYDRIGGPISIYGNMSSAEELVLNENSGWQGERNQFRGQWQADGTFKGEWISGDGERVLPFELRPSADTLVSFKLRSFLDSVQAIPSWAYSPTATFRVDWLEPQTEDPALNQFLRKEIFRGLVGDSLAATASSLQGALHQSRDDYFASYREELESILADGMLDTTEQEKPLSFSYEQDASIAIYFNSRKLLTLGYTDYYYMGGAHGNYGTTVAAYDLEQLRRLTIDDILKEGYEQSLLQALTLTAKRLYGLNEEAPLSEVFFEDELPLTDNFGLTEKGIFFVYQPYEIAPYAAGEIELYVPFADIVDVVREEWLPAEEE